MQEQDKQLREHLASVSLRYRRLLLRLGLGVCWLILALAGIAILAWARGANVAIPGIALLILLALPAVLLPLLLAALRKTSDPLWIARRIENRFPDLDARLLAALDQRPSIPNAPLGYLQQEVIRETLQHDAKNGWATLVPDGRLKFARVAQLATLLLFAIVLGLLIGNMRKRPSKAGWLGGGAVAPAGFGIKVEPEDTDLERGSSLLVLARFGDERLPGAVQLLSKNADGQVKEVAMSKSLDDPIFAGRVASVQQDLTYAVRYGDAQTRWFRASVFDYPDLKRADAKLQFPEYTGVAEKTVEDTRSITAVEGTKATFTFRLNKPVKDAQLLPTGAAVADPKVAPPVALSQDSADPSVYTVSLDLKHSQRFRLMLVDSDGRANKQPPELVLNVTQNRPADLKLQFPGKDVDVSPLQELTVKAQAWDDFGLKRVGVSYGIAGQETKDVVLATDVKGAEKKEVAQLVSMEKMQAKPDELLSYYVWAEDVGPDGKPRRASSDMFFAEVRDFETIMRQGQQPTKEEQERQRQQQQQGSQNAQQAEKLAELQKQIVSATWKLIRRETSAEPTEKFKPDVSLVGQSQTDARGQAAALEEKLEDAKSKGFVQDVLKHMDKATEQLASAQAGPSIASLAPALAAEQAAYQALLKLRAREIEVTRGQRQQQGQQSQSSASARRQEKLDQLELDKEDNRYETQRQAAPSQETAEQRETKQVLNRLKELAQRQEDLNKQMQELQSALEQAKEEAREEELKRQLARLRDQQQQQLRDTDELRDRMDQPENQQRMADSRQELEQTRENIRKSSEQLEKGMVPQATSAGARASEQLNNLRDQFRKQAAGQFNDAMNQMRGEARDLDKKQQDLSKQLNELGQPRKQQPGLRGSGDRQQVAKDLAGQKQQMDKLLDDMKKTIEESESSEPLLSKQLYDTIRDVKQTKADDALDASGKLLDKGFVDEAKQADADATRGVTKLREGVEKAALSVLGDEADALRRARDELDSLAQELDREIGRQRPNGASTRPTTRPGEGGERVARGNPTTRDSTRQGERPTTTQPGEGQPREQVARGNDQRPGGERQAQNGGRREPLSGRQPGEQPQGQQGTQLGQGQVEQRPAQDGQPPGQQVGQPGQQPGAGEQPSEGQPARSQHARGQGGRGQQPGQRGDGQQPGEGEQTREGQQPGQTQQARGQGGRGQQPGQGQPGQQPGESQAAGRGEGGQQPGDLSQPGQPGQAQARGQGRPGQQPGRGGQRPGGLRGGNNGGGSGGGEDLSGGDLRQFAAGGQNTSGQEEKEGPLTGDNFREWSDRLRDVEEMVSDPKLRADAAAIRDRAREVRTDLKKHSKDPNWDLVQEFVNRPLVELRDRVGQELLRRESPDALVPLDREPVPPEYAEQVRRYYEHLGSGASTTGTVGPSTGGGVR